ncbi:MAG: DUF945 family protein [Campylobacterales bacterium]|nr:DUF945 family protein [Campylobacterales bacterium]
MKKILLGAATLIAAGAIYYFTSGSEKLTEEMKQNVNAELTSLQQQGFTIDQREIRAADEHFVMTFNDPQKIAAYMSKQGMMMNVEDAKILQGMGMGVDVHYLPNTLDAISVDIYPVTLPQSIIQSAVEEDDKKALVTIQKLMEQKTFLVHVDFDKLLSGFKGYVKDIHEKFEADKTVTLTMEGFTFKGSIDKERELVKTATQNLKIISIEAANEFVMKLTDLQGDYQLTGVSKYDTLSHYEIANIAVDGKDFAIHFNHIVGQSDSAQKNDLLSASGKSTIDTITVDANGTSSKLDALTYDINISNLDINAIEQLSQTDPKDEIKLKAALQALLSKGIALDINTIGVEKIETEGKQLGGFALNGQFTIEKGLDIQTLENNPMAGINAISSKAKVELSTELFALIAEQPRSMMALMMFPPKDANGKKIYEIEFAQGMLKVNGMPLQ